MGSSCTQGGTSQFLEFLGFKGLSRGQNFH